MNWTIDTGEHGAAGCDAKDLRATLEKAMAYHAESAPQALENEILRTVDSEHAKANPAAIRDVAARAAAAKDEFLARLPKVQVQMKACIDAACALADAMGGRVTATCSGHHFPNHPAGTFKRVSVDVDRAAPTEE